MCLCYLFSAKTARQLVNRKADFLQNESIRIDSHNESNRIYSNRELECSNTYTASATRFYSFRVRGEEGPFLSPLLSPLFWPPATQIQINYIQQYTNFHKLVKLVADTFATKYAMCRTERLKVLALTTARRYRIVTVKTQLCVAKIPLF